MKCVGAVDDTTPCPHRAFHQVTSRSAVTPMPACKYHLYDVVDRITNQGFPAVVVRIG